MTKQFSSINRRSESYTQSHQCILLTAVRCLISAVHVEISVSLCHRVVVGEKRGECGELIKDTRYGLKTQKDVTVDGFIDVDLHIWTGFLKEPTAST